MVQHALWRDGIAHDHRPPGTHDAGFLETDAFAVLAQNGRVVDVDAGDHRTIGVHHVDGIEPPPQPDFEDHGIQSCLGHDFQNGQGAELEIRQAHLTTGLLHRLEGLRQHHRRGRLAVQTATLLEMHQMGRGVHPGLVPRFEQDGLEHGAGRALAVGSGHGDHRAVKAQGHAIGHRLDAVQPHVDGHRVQLLTKSEPFL